MLPWQPRRGLDRLPAKESHGTALQESLRRYPMAVCVSVWHFGLTRSKNRALNSPGVPPVAGWFVSKIELPLAGPPNLGRLLFALVRAIRVDQSLVAGLMTPGRRYGEASR